MKVFVVLFACVAVCAGSAIPLIPRDNSHYVEGESRYIWMSNGEGNVHLVDLQGSGEQPQFNETRNAADTQFWLFTRSNRQNRQVLVNGNANSIRNSHYNGNRPTCVVVHGWRNNGNSGMNRDITAALLALGDFNVIVVDWNRIASGDYLSVAAPQVPAIGRHVGSFIDWLFRHHGGNYDVCHLIGFSLGAHIVGNAGRTLGGRCARVTGLDPAGPTWHHNSNALNRNSGRYVESIHTDGEKAGIMHAISHADFYPNGGQHIQPGCGALDVSCSHGRAHQFFASSVRTNHFIGRQCRNLNEAKLATCRSNIQFRMGNSVFGKRGTGLYGLITGRSWPF